VDEPPSKATPSMVPTKSMVTRSPLSDFFLPLSLNGAVLGGHALQRGVDFLVLDLDDLAGHRNRCRNDPESRSSAGLRG
jgi:hypothetical protein